MLLNFPQSLDSTIRLAIQHRRLVEVRYKGQSRIAEPHDFGRRRGVDRLLVYQLRSAGFSGKEAIGWRLFDVAKIDSLIILDTTFKGSRRAPNQDHHTWDVLYARVD